MKKIFITSIAAFSLLSACKDKTAQGNVDYAVISGKVFLPGESHTMMKYTRRFLFSQMGLFVILFVL